jgi:hypothetical protein|tara:strand:- start:301 stop:498 length:198 start_codon:yes stop_codon:yes gene_type:complete
MSNGMKINFGEMDKSTTEGQLLLAACKVISGGVTIGHVEDVLIQLAEVHSELMFEKHLYEIIEKE